ncbi:MAG: beta-ketoacyl-[acyl-carrier-protein] synthase II, partial [Acidocella sp. 20-57-95]
MTALALRNYTLVTSLGAGRAATLAALQAGRSGLAPCHFDTLPLAAYVGEVAGLEAHRLTGTWAAYDCRNHRLAALALAQDGFLDSVAAARLRYGAAR